jgi:hypothetical protein
VANFAISFANVVDTGGKFAAGVNDIGGNLPPVTTTPAAANLHQYQTTPCRRCQRHRWQFATGNNDTGGGKFAPVSNDTGGKFCHRFRQCS